jgi:predicted nucleotidyltransferase
MQFREFAETLLGSRTKMKVIKYLMAGEAIAGERELAKRLGASHAAVNRTLKDFQELNLVTPLRIGTSRVWQLNKDSFAYEFLTRPLAESREPLKDLIASLKGSLESLGGVERAVLFGSIADGRELPTSDVDLFVLVANQEQRKRVSAKLHDLNATFIRRYGNALSAAVFTHEDAKAPKNKKFLENVNRGIAVFER